jgi:hypothetical protein
MFSQYWVANVPGSTITAAQSVVLQGLGDVTATAAEINAGVDGLTATSNELNNKADGNNSYVLTTTAAASEQLMATDTGRLMILGNTIASTQAILLPAEAAGLNYKFVYVGAAAEASNVTIGTEAAANFFVGGVVHEDVDGNTTATVYSDGNSNSLITLVTPAAGTEIEVLCNGTSWYLWGRVVSNTVPTITDT